MPPSKPTDEEMRQTVHAFVCPKEEETYEKKSKDVVISGIEVYKDYPDWTAVDVSEVPTRILDELRKNTTAENEWNQYRLRKPNIGVE